MRDARFRTMVAWGLVLLLLAQASGVAAQEDCSVIAQDGELRGCTFTEELASCMLESEDSFEQCREDMEGFWQRTVGCGITHAADDLACILATPISWGLGKLL